MQPDSEKQMHSSHGNFSRKQLLKIAASTSKFSSAIHQLVMSGEASSAAASAEPTAAAAADLATTSAAAAASAAVEIPISDNPAASALGRGEQLLNTIARLRAEQVRMRQERQALAKTLKAAQKKKNRLKVRARQLTDDDLVEVLRMRQTMKAAAGAAAASGPSASSSSSSDAPMPSVVASDLEADEPAEL